MRVERKQGRFRGSFGLPENVRPDQVRASLEDGVLEVHVPKRERREAKRHRIEIEERHGGQEQVQSGDREAGR